MYSHPGGYGVPWWAQARDCEALYGRAVAEATWGIGYYRDEPSSLKGEDHERRIADLERAVNKLFALAAMRQSEFRTRRKVRGEY